MVGRTVGSSSLPPNTVVSDKDVGDIMAAFLAQVLELVAK